VSGLLFYSEEQPKNKLILLGATYHLNHIAGHLDTDKYSRRYFWRSGFCITESCVMDLTTRLEAEMDTVQLDNCTVILQLYYNTVYQRGGARYLPKTDQYGRFHVTGTLQVADKDDTK
jgi:hypothetical protein